VEKILIKNCQCIVTCDNEKRQLEGYDLYIEGAEIIDIGKDLVVEGAKEIDATGMIVYPGLVNVHHHFYQVLTRNIPEIQKFELFDWLIWLYERWRYLTPESVYASSMVAMGELVKYGCTTMVDHHYVFPKGQENLIDQQFKAAKELGVRLHACRGSMSRGKSDGGLPPDDLVQTPQEIIRDSIRLIEQFHDKSFNSFSQVILAPCSPFSVESELLRESARVARKYGVRLHTHLAETRDEDDYCLKTLGLRPLAYMESVDWIGEDVFFAHGIHFNDEELKRLAETGTGVAHCPVSNMKLSSGIARVSEMLEMGIPVGLAVDGSASNDGSNLLAEIRTAYLLQRLKYNEKAPDAADILWLATRGGAKILGREDIGSLEIGKCADLFMIDGEKINYAGCLNDPAAIPGTVGINEPVELTMVGGEIIYEKGEFKNIEEKVYAKQVDEFSKKMR
jgi:cytosine/adenosine deaminase-related metal-dependent hydrolase